MAKEQDQILDLDVLEPVKRPRVKLPGGKLYDLTMPDDFGLVELQKIASKQKRIARIDDKFNRQKKMPSEAEVKYISETLTELACMLVRGAPREEIAGLDDGLKVRIIDNFNAMMPDDLEGDDAAPLSTSGS